MPDATIREARLRPEHAGSYPDIQPGAWHSAAALATLVLERGLYRNRTVTRGADRPLPDEHFEFRGPSRPPEQRPAGRSREADTGVEEAARDLRAGEERLARRVEAAESRLQDAEALEARAEELERREEEIRRKGSEPMGPLLP